jgi:RecA-family ATPase
MASKAHFGEAGRALWDEWSKTSDKFNARDQDKRWRSFNGSGIGIGTLFDIAKQNGYQPGRAKEAASDGQPGSASHSDGDLDQGENVPKESGCDIAPICAGTLLRKPAPPRRWLMPGWMPEGQVTLFAGDGGVGKSTFALQLAMSAAIGAPLFGIEIVKTRTLILSAEDDTNEMHYRLEKILDGLAGDREANRAALEGNFWLLDATDQLDPTLATYDDESGINPSETFSGIAEFIRKNGIGLFIADSAADVFAEEINRHAVRSFIRQLKKIGCTVLLLGHPSVDGMRTGRGYSGSTHWSNSVRSRLYFQQAKTADGSEPDPDLRVLEMPKTNRARAGQKIFLRWTENGFAREDSGANDIGALADKLKVQEVFLKLLRKFIQEGRAPSDMLAPKQFADHFESEGFSKKAFTTAKDTLLSEGKIYIEIQGPKSKESKRLMLKGVA